MKKLLIATDSFLPRRDGVAVFLSEMIPRLKDDYEITVIAPDFQGEYDVDPDIKVIRVPLFGFKINDFPPAKLSPKLIKRYVKESDIVWIQAPLTIGYLASKYAKKYKKPLLSYQHMAEWEAVPEFTSLFRFLKPIVRFSVKFMIRRIYNKCNLLMSPSKEMVHKLNKIKVKTPKTIIHLGVDTKKFKPAILKDEAKKKVGIDPKYTVIGYCGRIGREKDLTTLHRAFINIRNDFKDVILIIVGSGVREQTALFKEEEEVIITGTINNVIPYLQAIDIFVMPSLTETTSLSTMEAMACSAAVISTPVGLIKKYIKDEENGLLFPKGDVLRLRKKMRTLLESEFLRKKLGDNARKTIEDNYSWDKTAQKIKVALNSYL